MSIDSTNKIERLNRLDQRERTVLGFIMADKNVKIKDIASQMGFSEVYVRGFLTSVFKKLYVPEGEKDKRGFVVREFKEAYKEKYLKIEKVETPPSEPRIPSEIPSQIPLSEPKIKIDPPKRKIRTVVVWGGVVVTLAIGIWLFYYFSYQINKPLLVPQGELVVLGTANISLDTDFIPTSFSDCFFDGTGQRGFTVALHISNVSTEPFVVRFDRMTAFTAQDDLANPYELRASGFESCKTFGVEELELSPGTDGIILVSFIGEIPSEATQLYINVYDISGNGKYIFLKELQ